MIKKKHMESVTIKKIHSEEIRINGLELSLRVFTECNTSDYNDEGYNYFCSFIENKEQISQLLMYGAFYNNSLIGIAGFKENGTHLSLFFIEKEYQGLKVGKKLFNFAINEISPDHIIVSSSTIAVDFYKKNGFNIIENKRTKNGLTSVLMEYKINSNYKDKRRSVKPVSSL